MQKSDIIISKNCIRDACSTADILIHFHPCYLLPSTFTHFYQLSSTFINFHPPEGLPWSVSEDHSMALNAQIRSVLSKKWMGLGWVSLNSSLIRGLLSGANNIHVRDLLMMRTPSSGTPLTNKCSLLACHLLQPMPLTQEGDRGWKEEAQGLGTDKLSGPNPKKMIRWMMKTKPTSILLVGGHGGGQGQLNLAVPQTRC